MAKINNESFYLKDFTFDSNIGNYGIKLSGASRNTVLNLGKDVAFISLTALFQNVSEYNNVRKEFGKGDLSTLEIDDDTKYLAYPDAISIRRTAGDPLMGDFNKWRTADMSFLIPDPLVYGDKNSTSWNVSEGSPNTGTLKTLSIGGIEDVPLSISMETYNISENLDEGGIYVEDKYFGEPDMKWKPSSIKMKIYYLSCTGAAPNCGGDGFVYSVLPNIPIAGDEDWSWTEITTDTNWDSDGHNDVKDYSIESWTELGTGCYEQYWAVFKIEITGASIGDYVFMTNLQGSRYDYYRSTRLFIQSDSTWQSLGDNGRLSPVHGSFEGKFTADVTNIVAPNKIVLMFALRTLYEYNPFVVIGSCPLHSTSDASGFVNFINVQRLREPYLYIHKETEGSSFLTAITVNGDIENVGTGDDIYLDVLGTDHEWENGELLKSVTIARTAWGDDTFIPLNLDISDYSHLNFKFYSAKVSTYNGMPDSDALEANENQPKYILKLYNSSESSDYYAGYNMWYPFKDWEGRDEKTAYRTIPKTHCFESLSEFEVWNDRNPNTKLSLSGFLLGEYDAEYLKNLQWKFKDEYTSDKYVIAKENVSFGTGFVNISSTGYIMYSFNFGLPLISEPILFLKYSEAPSKIEVYGDDKEWHDVSIPPNNISSSFYSSESPLTTKDSCYLKISGPANISEFNIFGEGSGYLFALPEVSPDGDNEIKYNISGIHDNVSGTLSWREAEF